MLRRERIRKGFTLIELLVVLVILALLAGIVLPRFLERSKDAQVSAAKSQISNFKNALNLYMLDNGQPPTTQQGLEALVTEPTSSPRPRNWKKYLGDATTVPLDPWQNPYKYEAPGPDGEEYLITSLGADGREGGESYDADITSVDSSK